MMLHSGNLALLGNSCIFIRQSRSDQGPTANRNMSSLLVTKTTRAFPLPERLRFYHLGLSQVPGDCPGEWDMGHRQEAVFNH